MSTWRDARVALGTWPTPVQDAGALRKGLWIKDDGMCAPGYAGNKVRKLEFLLHGAGREIATMGATGSHHVLATAVHGSALGHEVHAVTMPRPWSAHTEKVLRATGCRATLHHADDPVSAEARLEHLEADGMTTFPAGGSSGIGACGFIVAAQELAEQVAAGALPEPERVFCALGTAGTAVGLAMGLRHCGLATRVIGVRVVPEDWLTPMVVRDLAHEVSDRTGLSPVVPDIHDDQLGAGYGRDTPQGLRAVERMAQTLGLTIEATYTGKALAAALLDVGPCDLFWQTTSLHDLGELLPAEPEALEGVRWAGRSSD